MYRQTYFRGIKYGQKKFCIDFIMFASISDKKSEFMNLSLEGFFSCRMDKFIGLAIQVESHDGKKIEGVVEGIDLATVYPDRFHSTF